MILDKLGESIETKSGRFAIGDRVSVVESDYAGLLGCITEIRTGRDRDTGNVTAELYCYLDVPDTDAEIRMLEKHFSALFQQPKTVDDICLDSIIMAPYMLKVMDR